MHSLHRDYPDASSVYGLERQAARGYDRQQILRRGLWSRFQARSAFRVGLPQFIRQTHAQC
jgi:hypothetical protein